MNEQKILTKKEKERSLKGSSLWGALVFLLLLLIDMVTKIVADAYFTEHPGIIKIIPGWIELTISYNRGASFSLGTNSPTWAKMALIAGTGVLFVIFAIVYLKTDKRRAWLRWALVFIVAGGVGNLIDRAYYRVWDESTYPAGVRDMVALNMIFSFPVCNFADFFIVGGSAALILSMFFFDSSAIFPLTKKYKALAKEETEKEERKAAEKSRRAAEKARAKAEANQKE